MDGTEASRASRRSSSPRTSASARVGFGALTALRIRSVGATCAAGLALDRPLIMELAAEDVCWWVAMRHWRGQEPSIFRVPARRAWQAEGRRLRDWRRRLVQYAEEAGLRIA